MIKVGIIGGGATGLMCAAKLSKTRGTIIDILEKEKRVGKKILQTGNGRCNFTNMNVKPEKYNSPNFVKSIINEYSPNLLRDEFFSMGLVSYQDEEARCYPLSDSATSVLDVLRNKCKINGVFEKTDHEVLQIKKTKSGYQVICKYNQNEDVSYEYDYVVICTGGSAKPLPFVEKLNINYTKTKQSLCAIKANVSGLTGIRSNVRASLYLDDVLIKQDEGEILFKDGALSGIVMFNLSAFVARNSNFKNGYIEIDLLPSYDENSYSNLWDNRIKNLKNISLELFMIGMFPKMLAQYIIKKSGLSQDLVIKDLNKKNLEYLKYICKHLKFEIKPNFASNNSQVIHGGIDLKEVKDTLELIKYKNIFVGGEVLDIDGECGGYNLHFAFSCGLKIANLIKK